MITTKSPDEINLAALQRQILEVAAKRLEAHHCGVLYGRALKKAAKLIREMKPD